MPDSCSSVDFNNVNTLRAILTNDKHTRIEGLCSEYLFMEDIGRSLDPIVSDYWISMNDYQYHLTKFVPDTKIRPSNNDFLIFAYFHAMNISVRIVYFDESKRTFFETFYKKDKCKKFTDPIVCEFNQLTELKGKLCEEERFNKALDFLLSRQTIKSVALKRIFANHIMSECSWDLDGFHITKDKQILLFEVKHKYPAGNHTFGINVGQAKMLKHLTDHNIKVIHTILLKPMDTERISAIDLVTDPCYKPVRWIHTLFDYKALTLVEKVAPSKTQFRGTKTIRYYEIKESLFKDLKILGEPYPFIREDIYRMAGIAG